MTGDAFRHRALMVSGAVDRAILHLGVPAVMAAVLQAAFLMVDAFWLGRVGPVALAAASTAGFIMWLAQSLGDGFAAGSGAVLATAIGAGRKEAAGEAVAAGRWLALWAAVAVAVVGIALSGPIFRFMGTAPEVSEAGLVY
jgi:Na+-driven multidrug efflux pump